jgi:hypothetical protein
MARIKRYISDTEALLRSEQASIMSPAQAAATEQAKYRTVQDAANLGQNINRQFAELREEEEYNSAQAQYRAAVAEIDRSIDEMPPEVDEDGNITFTPGRMRSMQDAAHTSVTGAIRGQITSAGARRAFDNMASNERQRRTDIMADKEMKAEVRYRRNTALVEANVLAEAGLFDEAQDRLNRGMAAGWIDPLEHQKEYTALGKARDSWYGWTVAKTGSLEDMEEAMIAFTLGQHPPTDGKAGVEMTMSPEEQYRMKAALVRIYDDKLHPNDDAKKELQRKTYVALWMKGSVQGGLTMRELSDAVADNLLTTSDFDKLSKLIVDPDMGIVNDIKVNTDLADQMGMNLLYNYDGDASKAIGEYAFLTSEIPMLASTRNEKVEKFRGIVEGVMNDATVANLRKDSFERIATYTEGDLQNMQGKFFGQFNNMREVGREFERDVILEAHRMGGPFDNAKRQQLTDYVESRAPAYKLKALDGELRSIGSSFDYPIDQPLTDEQKAQIGREVNAWVTDPAREGTGAADRVLGVFENIQRLTGIDLLYAYRKENN